MIEISSKPKNRERVWLWLAKLVLGVLIVVVMILHMIINHLVAPGGLLTYADVVKYYSNPIIPFIEIFFLIIVVSHSLLGTRSIVLDLNFPDQIQSILDWLFLLAGSTAVIYGIWLVIVIVGKGLAL